MIKLEIRKNRILAGVKRFFTRNLTVKIIAFLFALILWGYVLTDLNPYRVKSLPNVSTSFDGEAELMAQGLCVRGNREELLKAVSVAVRTRITNYADLSENSVTATVSLKNISQPQEYELPIQASISSALGVVQQVTPATIKVEIDSLVSKTVPVSCVFQGELPEGYWADMDAISSTSKLDIQGAKTDVSKISRAECVIDLTGRTSTIFGTFDVNLYDADDQLIDSDIVVGTLPSSTVRLPIYSVKTVPVDVYGALLGADKLAANYELASAVATPQNVRIIGDQSVIDSIESMALEPFSISGLGDKTTVESELIVPEGVRLIDSPTVSVALDIREKTDAQEHKQIPIEITGLADGLTATVTPECVDLRVEGRISLIALIKRSDIKIDVDVTGLSAGTYELPLSVFVRNEEATVELTLLLTVNTVSVVIR